jgi:hypothetical protein
VATRGDGKRTLISLVEKIGDEKNDGAASYHFVQILKGGSDIRAAVTGLEEKHLADQAKCVQAAFLRADEELHLIGEKEQTHLVVVLDRTEREDRRDFGRQLALARINTSEIT